MATPTRSPNRLPAALGAFICGAVVLTGGRAQAATFAICRMVDISGPPTAALLVPAGSLFRDNGRSDDPLAAFTRDYWQLRLETLVDVTIPALSQCATVNVRITSDSAVKSAGVGDNRQFIYAGSANLLDVGVTSEELLGLIGYVVDHVP